MCQQNTVNALLLLNLKKGIEFHISFGFLGSCVNQRLKCAYFESIVRCSRPVRALRAEDFAPLWISPYHVRAVTHKISQFEFTLLPMC